MPKAREERRTLSVAQAHRQTVRDAKRLAKKQGVSLSEYVWTAVRSWITRNEREAE